MVRKFSAYLRELLGFRFRLLRQSLMA